MPRLAAEPLLATEEQREELERLIRKRTESQQLVKRAKIIVMALDGVGVRETTRELRTGRIIVQNWRRRWLDSEETESVIQRLSDLPRSGTPRTFQPAQVSAIVAIACEDPQGKSARPITHWTCREIAEEAVKRGIVDKISTRAVSHFLKRCNSQTAPDQRMA